MIYWLTLLVGLLGNFVISIILLFFMLIVQGFKLYLIIIIIGFAFGAFFNLLIRSIKNVENRNIIIGGSALLLLTLINTALITSFSNSLQQNIGLNNVQYSPIIISVAYTIAFGLPYFIFIFYSKE